MTEYLEIEDKTVLITGDNLELLIKITEEFALEDKDGINNKSGKL